MSISLTGSLVYAQPPTSVFFRTHMRNYIRNIPRLNSRKKTSGNLHKLTKVYPIKTYHKLLCDGFLATSLNLQHNTSSLLHYWLEAQRRISTTMTWSRQWVCGGCNPLPTKPEISWGKPMSRRRRFTTDLMMKIVSAVVGLL